MADESNGLDNLVLRYLREIDRMKEGISGLKSRVTALEAGFAVLGAQIAALSTRLDRVETRLDRIERPPRIVGGKPVRIVPTIRKDVKLITDDLARVLPALLGSTLLVTGAQSLLRHRRCGRPLQRRQPKAAMPHHRRQ